MTGEQAEHIASLKRQALRSMAANRLDAAQDACNALIAAAPQDAEAWCLLGTINGRRGRITEAGACSRRAIELQPDYGDAYVNLGHTLLAQGQPDQALAQYQTALRINPACAEAHLNIGNILLEGGGQEAAIGHYRQALRLKPDFARAHNNLGSAFFELGQVDEARRSFQQALGIDPGVPLYLNNYAKTCQTPAQCGQYLHYYREALKAAPDPREVRSGLTGIIDSIELDAYAAWLDQELQICYALDEVDTRSLGRASVRLLRLKHRGFPADQDEQRLLRWAVEHIAPDALFLSYLEKSVNTDAELEILLTRLRRILLDKHRHDHDAGPGERALIRALARQGANNEYVFALDAEEQSWLTQLRSAIEDGVAALPRATPRLELNLTVFSMYEPLGALSCRTHLGRLPRGEWSAAFRPLLDATLINFLEEERLKQDIASLGRPGDRTSQSVQAQYEENPYPRWLSLPAAQKTSIQRVFKQLAPHLTPPPFLDGPLRILVAGCGTGKHPLLTARNYSNTMHITAVDLSKSSLAYAARMARKLGVSNVEFMQGDILELGGLKQRFHLIECIGVLHHMEDPLAGWRVLSGLLVDGGLMSVGLYSELARADVVTLRAKIARLGLGSNTEDLRRFRNEILHQRVFFDGRSVNLINSHDFFTTSGCRDLLFHVMEHRFTLPQIARALSELKLRFIGFRFAKADDIAIKHRFRALFPDEDALTDLGAWAQFETLHPDSFANMYQFWCQKT